MPKSRGRKKPAARRAPPARRGPLREDDLPPLDPLISPILRGGRELLARRDPLDAETWASGMLGLWYRPALPPLARIELNKRIRPAIVQKAERAGTAQTLAVLRAFASLDPDPIAPLACAAADRLAARGIEEPTWASELGSAELVDAWVMTDAYGDADAYYASFRYPGREPHVLAAVINRNLGGILRDSFCGFPEGDFRAAVTEDPRIQASDVDPGEMAARVIQAIEIGDQYLDNAWSEEFKRFRALLLARMSRLPRTALPDRPEPPSDTDREVIIKEFLAGLDDGVDLHTAEAIANRCLEYSCDYSCDGDPFRWSPCEVEGFLVGWLPRKAMLDMGEIRAMPEVLRAWVRFALERRGLPDDLVEETQEAVKRWMPEFRKAASNPRNFGPAKAITTALLADGVDPLDQVSVDAWIGEFNSRPQHEREELLGRGPLGPA